MIPQSTPTSHVPYYRAGVTEGKYQRISLRDIEDALWHKAVLHSIYSAQLPKPAVKPLTFSVPGYRAFDLVTRRMLWGYSEKHDAWLHAREVMTAPSYVHRTFISATIVTQMHGILRSTK